MIANRAQLDRTRPGRPLTPRHTGAYRSRIAEPSSIESPTKPSVLCVKWGDKYGAEYVNRLRSMVSRHLSIPHDFVCLTDNPMGIDPGIQILPLPESDLEYCWNKLWIFSPAADRQLSKGVRLYLDLDVIITGSLDDLLRFDRQLDFVGVLDWNRWWCPQFNSSVMRFAAGHHADLYRHFLEQLHAGQLIKRREWDHYLQSRDKVVYWRWLRRFGSDQEWISQELRKKGRLGARSYPRSWVLSYKRHCRARVPDDCRIAVFHGEPKPHQIGDPHIVAHWR